MDSIMDFYNSCLPLIKSKARKASTKQNIEYGEMLSQANLIFCETFQKRDKSRNIKEFNKYLDSNLYFELKKFSNKYHNQIQMDEEINEDRNIKFTDYEYDFILFYNSLSDDAKKIIDLLLDPPKELFEIREETKSFWDRILTAKTLKSFINKTWGWSYCKINNVFSEIKNEIC